MADVILKTPEGDKLVNTSGIPLPVPPQAETRRVMPTDMDGKLGAFLAEVLCEIAPNAFHAGNWKGKLSIFITSRTSSFLCCGRAVGLAHLEQDTMTGQNKAIVLFCIVADGGSEEDGYSVLKAIKQWARDLDVPVELPRPEYCNLAPGKLRNFFKADKAETWVIPALKK